jgi:hypothetical protein
VKLVDARIGYAAYSRDFRAPGDRRRFVAYARLKGLSIEYAQPQRAYDFVYVTYSSDLAGWVDRKRRDGNRLKLVFELIDSYLGHGGPALRFSKGTARYLLGTESRFSPDFGQTLIDACKIADAVVCSTEEQAAAIRPYNPNVVISFDWFGDDVGDDDKADYRRGEKLRLVWEGQSATLSNLRSIRVVLNDLRDRIELHVVSDPQVYRYFGRFLPHASADLLRGFECGVHFHPWERATFTRHVTAADVGIIPIDPANAFARGKPENKLVMLWQLGLPVLTSDTPAYRRAMEAAGLDLLCGDKADWRAKLERMIAASDTERERLAGQARAFAERGYSRNEFVARFDGALGLAGIEVP